MIIYYSGTGNSLSIAQQLGAGLNETIVHINEAVELGVIKDTSVGFVLPVHSYDAPRMVVDAIQALEFPNLSYAYCVITHGGNKGNTVLTIKNILHTKGKGLNYHNDILMPVNSRIMYGMVTDKIEERIGKAVDKTKAIVHDVNSQACNTDNISSKFSSAVWHRLMETKSAKRYFTPVIDAEACVNCGICESVCPVDNISMKDHKRVIGDNCVQCTTCMHWCPQVAIHYSNRRIRKEQQYHHPEKNMKDIAVR